jgi:5-methylcytosine-specific restriction endonuclease McrA
MFNPKRVLVLDSLYRPIGTIGWQGAIVKVFSERAEVIHDSDQIIRSVSRKMFIPSVIRLKDYKRFAKENVAYSKRNLYVRDNGQCQYCGKQLSYDNSTVDHVKPRCRGGLTSWSNTVIACKKCNSKKGMLTIEEFAKKLLKVPKKPGYYSFLPKAIKITNKNYPEEWEFYLNPRS